MHAKFATCRTVLALDVGKASHWAVMAARFGEILANRPVANRERELNELFASAPEGTLVVGQKRCCRRPRAARGSRRRGRWRRSASTWSPARSGTRTACVLRCNKECADVAR